MDARYKIAEAMMRGVGQPMAAFPDQRQDDDMALRGMASDLYQADQKRAQDYRAGIKEAILQSWPAELAKSAYGAATLPGDVYAGKVNPMSDEAVGRAAEFAGLMTLGAGGVPAGRNEMRMGIKAYHGSPHDFPAERLVRFPDGRTDYIVGKPDVLPIVPPKAEIIQDFPLGRFRMDKIGTGEGAQAYGHGLYAAEREGIAKGYRDALKPGKGMTPTDTAARAIDGSGGDVAAAIKAISERIDDATARGIPYDEIKSLMQAKNILNIEPQRATGRMYEVNLNTTPDRLLDWDKPLREQSQYVQEALNDPSRLGLKPAGPLGERGWMGYVDENNRLIGGARTGKLPDAPFDPREIGSSLARGAGSWKPTEATERLKRAGVDGIKYLDAGSRAAGDGSRNYVMFDDKLVQILRKYGVATAAALPAAALAELGMSREEAKRSF